MESKPEAGFSLLEVLISLAFFSLISVLLFQSLLTQYRALDRVENAIETNLDDAAQQQFIRQVLSEIIAGWPSRPESQLSGNASYISGLTTASLSSETSNLVPFTLEVTPSPNGAELVMTIDQTTLPAVNLGSAAALEYYGYDGKWRSDWPPSQDDEFFSTSVEAVLRVQPLPEHIRLVSTTADRAILLSATIAQRESLPTRLADILATP